MASLEITFDHNGSTMTVKLDGFQNEITDTQADEIADVLKSVDAVESNLGGTTTVAETVVISRRTT